jgi:hypothetical protein
MSSAYVKCDRVALIHRATAGIRFITLDCDDDTLIERYPDENERFFKAIEQIPEPIRRIAFFTKSRNKKLPHVHIQVYNHYDYDSIASPIINCLTFWKGDLLMPSSWETNAHTTDVFVCSDNTLNLEYHMDMRQFNCTYDTRPRETYTSSMTSGTVNDIDFTELFQWITDEGRDKMKRAYTKMPKQIRDVDMTELTNLSEIIDDIENIDDHLFKIFKRSPYYNVNAGLEIASDSPNTGKRVIIKAHNHYHCKICNREHIKNSNRTYIFLTNNIIGYFCRKQWRVLVNIHLASVDFREVDTISQSETVIQRITESDEITKWYLKQKQLFEYGSTDNTIPIRFKCESIFVERTLRSDIDDDDDIAILNQITIKSQKHFTEKFMDFAAMYKEGNIMKPVMFYDRWLADPKKCKFDKMVFNIDRDKTPSNHFNLFEGFEIENNHEHISDNEILSLVEPLINTNDGLFYNICGANKTNMDYFLKILSGIIQNIRPCIMVIFKDAGSILKRQYGGSGKDTAITWFCKKIIGMKYYFECESTEDAVDKFNMHLSNKIVVNIPEVSSMIKQTHVWSRMKNKITSNTTVIHGKGQDKVILANSITYFASTNDDIIFKDDRRLWVVDVDISMKNNVNYWNNMHNNVLSDKRVQKAFYLYLLKHVKPYESSVEFQNNKPVTESMNESKEDNLSLLNDFFVDMVEDKDLSDTIICIYKQSRRKDNLIIMPTVDILSHYKSWCEKRHYKCEITSTGFGRILSRLSNELVDNKMPLFITKQSRHGSRNSYIIDMTNLKEWYRCMFDTIEEDNQSSTIDDKVMNYLRRLKDSLSYDLDGSLVTLYRSKLLEYGLTDHDI